MQRISRNRFIRALTVLMLLGWGVVSATAQQQGQQLPPEVRAYLERDQRQRWSTMIETGSRLFSEGSCFRCHDQGGTGSPRGPDLTDEQWVQGDGSLEQIAEVIFWGVRRRDFANPRRPFQMNPSGGMQLEFAEIEALAAYVWTLSNGDQLSRR